MKINESLIPYFYQAGSIVHYTKQDTIYMQEDDSSLMYLIIKGRVRVYTMSREGKETTYEILEHGDIFGESSCLQNVSRPTTVEALCDVEMIAVSLQELYPYMMQSKDLMIAMFQLMSYRCDYVTSKLKKSIHYNRFEKVASFLIEQSQQSNTITYSHQEIADTVGLSRVSVSKILRSFEKEGYLKILYRQIEVHNKKALLALLQDK